MLNPILRKLHQLFDRAKECWYDGYEVMSVEGKLIRVEVPREEQSLDKVRRHLLRAGADLPPLSQSKEMIAAAIKEEAPVIHRAAQVGWQPDGTSFVSHHQVLGTTEGATLVPPDLSSMSEAPSPAAGMLADWLEVIKVAECSTAMVMVLCATFAAPLIRPLRRQCFGLVLVGPSRTGKSTVQLVGASAQGFASEDAMPSLNASDVGLIEKAITFCDHMMPLNELGTVKGGQGDVYEATRSVTYAITNGRDKIRHSSWTGGKGGSTATFRVLVIASSEHSPDTWAERKGVFRDEGETARFIGVPVVR